MKKILAALLMITTFTGYVAFGYVGDIFLISEDYLTVRSGSSGYNDGMAKLDSTRYIGCNYYLGSTPNESECGLYEVNSDLSITQHSTSSAVDQMASFSSYNGEAVCVIDTDKFVFVYADDTLGDDGYARVGSISGDTITGFGTALEFETGDTEDETCVTTGTNKFFILYNDETAGDVAQGRACSVSGTTISCGTISRVNAVTDYLPRRIDCAQLNTDKVACTFAASDLSNALYAVAATIDGSNNITFGTVVQVSATSTSWAKLESTYPVSGDADQFAIVLSDGTTGARVVAASVSGTTITLGSEYPFTASNGVYISDQAIAFLDGTRFGIVGTRGSGTSFPEGFIGEINWGTKAVTINPARAPLYTTGTTRPTELDILYLANEIGVFAGREVFNPNGWTTASWIAKQLLKNQSTFIIE